MSYDERDYIPVQIVVIASVSDRTLVMKGIRRNSFRKAFVFVETSIYTTTQPHATRIGTLSFWSMQQSRGRSV